MNIDGNTQILGIIGNPVRHTKSPAIHNFISEKLGKNMIYVPFEVTGDVKCAVKGAYELGIVGMNVTVPYKTDVMDVLVDIDDAAKKIGAVNTLVRVDGGYKGYNTDMTGLMRAVRSDGFATLSGMTAVILGAGGAARAAAYMCVRMHAKKIYILNRTLSKADAIAEDVRNWALSDVPDFSIETLPVSGYDKITEDDLVVFQCTKIGLNETDGAVIEDASFYKKIKYGVDLIYRDNTKFQQLVNENGGFSSNGAKMLMYQGISAYELWNDISLDKSIVKGVERLFIEDSGNIILVGYMGSGKSTIGLSLSLKNNMDFVDTDELISKDQSCTINEIFDKHGEQYFRDLETELIKKMCRETKNTVISCGGGMPLRDINRFYLKKLGTVVYLSANAETIFERLKGDTTRPLLKGEPDEVNKKINSMISERAPYYTEASDMTVCVDDKTVDEIVDLICYNDSGSK